MAYIKTLKNILIVTLRMIRYNITVIFANKFIYFLTASLAIFLFVSVVYILNAGSQITEASVFWLLLVPGILLVFYPVTFGIQNDADNRMLELVFGIPNYRYKVLLVRLMLIFFITFVVLLLIGLFSSFALITIPVADIVYHLMFPVIFFGSISFAISTMVKDGTGTAVIVLILGIIMWIGRSMFQEYPRIDLFLNPFDIPRNTSELAWAEIVSDNRLYLFAGSIVAILYSLLNLQKREKFL